MTRLLSALLLLVAAPAMAADVGLRQLTVPDSVTGESFPVTVFYPSTGAAVATALGSYTLTVALGAAPASGSFPLAVISHGSGGSTLNHHDLAMVLVERGMVVAAPQHPRDNYRDQSGVGSFEVWAGRPKQLSETIDAVLADAALGPAIDRQRIGAIGHSAGGYAVLAALGGRADMSLIPEHCRTVPDDAAFCAFGLAVAPNANRQIRPLPDARDPRIRAAVVMAPLGQLFTPASLGGIVAPLRIYAGEHDDLLVNRYHAEMIRDALAPRAEYRMIADAGHYSFLAPFPPSLAGRVGPADHDPPGLDRATLHRRLNGEIADFLAGAFAAQ